MGILQMKAKLGAAVASMEALPKSLRHAKAGPHHLHLFTGSKRPTAGDCGEVGKKRPRPPITANPQCAVGCAGENASHCVEQRVKPKKVLTNTPREECDLSGMGLHSARYFVLLTPKMTVSALILSSLGSGPYEAPSSRAVQPSLHKNDRLNFRGKISKHGFWKVILTDFGCWHPLW